MFGELNITVNENILREISNVENPIDAGSINTLIGLVDTMETLEDSYNNKDRIPYDKLYHALKTIIIAGSRDDGMKTRKGLMSGTVLPKKVPSAAKVEIKPKAQSKGHKHTGTEDEIREFAKTHTISEIAAKFNFNSVSVATSYLCVKNIPHVVHKVFDKERVSEMAKNHTCAQLARIFCTTPQSMHRYLNREKINYKGKRYEQTK